MTLAELKQSIIDNSWDGQSLYTDHEIAEMSGYSRCHICRVRQGMGIRCLPREYEPKPDYSIHRYDIAITFNYLEWLNREKQAYRAATGREPDGPALKRWIDTHGCRVMEARGVA